MKSKAASLSRTVKLKAEEPELVPTDLTEIAIKKILVPVDFSDSSRKAIQYAVNFSRLFKSEILLLHVVSPTLPAVSDYTGGITVIDAEPTGVAEKKRLTDWSRGLETTSVVRTAVRNGMASHEIIQTAQENNIDLIIIGRRGRSGLAHLLLGGTAEYVLRHAPCPTLVVRELEHDFINMKKAGSRQSAPNGKSAPTRNIRPKVSRSAKRGRNHSSN